jgi:hypothetical protein
MPGRICGPVSEAWVLNDYPCGTGELSLSEWLRHAVSEKCRKATKDPGRRGDAHVVALVIDEAAALSGRVLLGSLLGHLIYERLDRNKGGRSYRTVPKALFDEATRLGRADLLSSMQFDSDRLTSVGQQEGLFFDRSVCGDLDGVFALYYTDDLQFVPNPFACGDIALVRDLFSLNLQPFAPALAASSWET